MSQRRRFKLKIEEAGMLPEDRAAIIEMHKHIHDLKSLAKTKDADIRSILNDEIRSIRNKLTDEYCHKFYYVKVILGPHSHEEEFPHYPDPHDIVYVKDKLLKRISKNREMNKIMRKTHREFNGIVYEMIEPNQIERHDEDQDFPVAQIRFNTEFRKPVQNTGTGYFARFGGGRVFEKKGSVVGLLGSPEYAQRIRRAKKPYDKANYVGVEFEVIAKVNPDTLNQIFVDAKLAGNVYVKNDSSVRPDDNHYKDQANQYIHEVTMIAKQSSINDIITRVCDVLNSKKVEAYVNNTCGLHVHLDMRSRDAAVCYKNLYYCLGIMMGMIPQNRLNNKYCIMNNTPDVNVAAKKNPNPERDPRYQAINACSLNSHRTIEIRMHSGSTNAMKINNWVNLLTAIVDKKTAVENHIKYAEDLIYHFGIDAKMVEYIKCRTEKFAKNASIDNKQDNLDQTA